jgi:hypothetical protein
MAVPKGSSVKQILINGVAQTLVPAVTDTKIYESKTFKAPQGLELEQFYKDNSSYFAFITTVPPIAKSVIEVDYDNGATKPLSTIADYTFVYIKQPGTPSYKLTTTIDYPEGYVPVNTKADSYGKNFLEESGTIQTDFKTQIELQKASILK